MIRKKILHTSHSIRPAQHSNRRPGVACQPALCGPFMPFENSTNPLLPNRIHCQKGSTAANFAAPKDLQNLKILVSKSSGLSKNASSITAITLLVTNSYYLVHQLFLCNPQLFSIAMWLFPLYKLIWLVLNQVFEPNLMC